MPVSFSAIVLALCTLCLACGSSRDPAATSRAKSGDPQTIVGAPTTSKSGTASTSGSVQGHSLMPQWAAFAAGVDSKNSIYLVLSSQDAYCSNVGNGVTTPNHTSIVLSLSTVTSDAATPAPTPGTYPIVTTAPGGAGNFSLGRFYVTDATCSAVLSDSQSDATGGSVHVTAVSSTQVAGTFTMTIGSDTVTGTFDTVPCAALVAQAKSGASLSCQDS